MKKKSILILVIIIAIVIVLGVFVFKFLNDKTDYSKITYNNIDYELVSNDIGVNFNNDIETTSKILLNKIDTYNISTIYEIKDISKTDFLYFDSETMLGNTPMGLYKNVNLKIDSVGEFKPTSFNLYYYDENTQTENVLYNTNDLSIMNDIDNLVDEKNIVTNYPNYNDNCTYYNLEFISTTYPNLRYSYYYIEDTDGNYYLKSEKKAYKINDYLYNLRKSQ